MLIYHPHKKSPPEQWGMWFNGVLMQPGTNYFSPATMLELSANPAFASMVADGIIEILEAPADEIVTNPDIPVVVPPSPPPDEPPPDEPPSAELPPEPPPVELLTPETRVDLSDMRASDAIALIKITNSIEQLDSWSASEGRVTVLSAINARLAELHGSGE